jgi:uncharacterized protein YfaS (alpha-2-macroglobulin family)
MSRRTAAPLSRSLAVLLLLAMLLSACGPATPTQPPPTPVPLPAPHLLSYVPAPGEEQPLDAPIQLTFDEPMDHPSVEAAFSITPTVAGQFTWSDDRTVSFAPSSALERGKRYRVTVAATATNAEGLALEEAATFDFSTVGFLAVSQVQPTPGTDELSPDMIVTVVFNRPVVPLTAISEQAQLPDPVTFMPPVAGKGEWLNSAIYVFRPQESFLPATEYTGRVAAGLTDVTGAVLEQDYTWTFGTLRPAVQSISPEDGFQYVGPSAVISVTFNQPMDHASAEEHFALATSNGKPVTGTFAWSGGEKATSVETMAFVPAEPLPRSTLYAARLARGALARAGGMATESETISKFQTVNEPGVVSTWPQDGQTGFDVYSGVTIVFNSPMNTEVFTRYLTLSPAVPITTVYAYWGWEGYDTQVQLYFAKEPATRYTVVLAADMPDKYGAPLGQDTRLRFTTGDLAPLASFNTGGQLDTISAYTDTTVYVNYRNVSRLDLSLYQLSPSDFMRLNGFGDWDALYNYKPSPKDLIRSWALSVRPPRNATRTAGFNLLDAEDQPLAPGLYYVELTAPEVREAYPDSSPERFMLVRSRINLALKQAPQEALVWATDLASGQPVADLPVQFYSRQGTYPGGSTDSDGLALNRDVPRENMWDPFFAMAGQPGDDGFAIAFGGWDSGISAWDFNVNLDYWPTRFKGYLYTDRPIYRPGQTVYFKGIARADDDAHYSLPGNIKTLTVRISDPQGKELYNEDLPLNDMGTLNGQFLLDGEAALGNYSVEMVAADTDLYVSSSFLVAEYRKPEYQVDVRTDREAYLAGDTINVTAEATYYFGGPVADASVHWSVLSDDYYFTYQCPLGQSCPWYDWTDYEWEAWYEMGPSSYGQVIASGDTRTDAQGRATFQVPADIARQGRSQRFTIEASVTDINGQQVSNRTATIVHQGEFYVGLAPEGYLTEVGQEKTIDLITVDWDSQPVAGVPLTVIFMEHRWYSVRQQDESGNYYWNWSVEDIPVFTTTVSTGEDGKATATFTPAKAGAYRVRAIGRDSRENEIRSSTYFWVWGGSEYVSWRQESNNRIALVADKKEYNVGDTAEILVPSPYSGTVEALVTIERGHIVQTEVRQLQGNSEVLRIPITEDYVPNVFVSVLIVQGSEQAPDGLASFKMGLINLPIAVADKELTITLAPDKDMQKGEHYGPRQTATYNILTTDHQGNPVEAELSLRLADLAVLALADEPGPTLLDTFWQSRGLGVQTSVPLVVSLEKFNRETQPGKKGGGGGGEEAAGLVRTNFADTAYWNPTVRTDQDGKAQVQVELPDNLTTWRMQARGVTADTQVGQVNVDVLSTLDLLVRPVLPRFFVIGDQAEIATIVHNNTSDPQEVEVSLTVDGLALEGNSSQTVPVPAKDKVKVVWPVTAQPVTTVTVRMAARAGVYSDAVELKLPVYHYSTPEVVATAGRLSEAGQRQEVIQLPRTYDSSQGELIVQLEGSLTAATKDALKYLEHYPYECVEQTTSRFLPNVLTYQALKEMGLSNPDLEQKLSQMVGIALQRLYAYQHYDGGWGWWVDDKSNSYLTAYVLQGLLEAHRAGFVVDSKVIDRGAHFLQENIPSVSGIDTHWQANRTAYMLYVLAECNATFHQAYSPQANLGLAIRLFEKRDMLDLYGRATLALALGLMEPDEKTRVNTLLSDLSGSAIVSAAGTHWEEANPDYWNMNTDMRSTAIVLWAMSRLDPQSDLLPNVVRWLMAMRKEGHWESTQDTAWSLLGLVAYMRASGEMEGDFSYAVYLNGEVLGSGAITQANLSESQRLQVEIASLLKDEANRLVIERQPPKADQTGKGQLYYTAYLRYFLPADMVKALDRGIIVARQYSPVEQPGKYLTGAQVGDVILVKLTIIAPSDLYYVVVEDPLPAGCEGVDTSLKTTSVVGQAPELHNLTAEEQDRWYRYYGWGWWWFSHSEMRDEKVVLFANYLPRGTYEYTYLMRASVPGTFLVMPSNAYQMYFPEVFGRSDGGKFTVTPGQ